ncbi:hypothetical protein FOA52_010439 [Chlamydomonas sp. UWO 241]|nr:hypothetical protein FOA52_010439 [Chlamydomonas sp. UWO 241]
MTHPSQRLNLAVAVLASVMTLYEVNQRQSGYGSASGKVANYTPYVPLPINWSLIEQTEPVDTCRMEHKAEYDGAVVQSGTDHKLNTAAECCEACRNHPQCNVWVWCGRLSDCAPGRTFRECWLKQSTFRETMLSEGFPEEIVGWTSGALFQGTVRERMAEEDRRRLLALAQDENLPLVYLDVGLNNLFLGRVYVTLFKGQSPLAAENFRQLCTGEAGVVLLGSKEFLGNLYHLRAARFYRIVDRFIAQAGIDTDSVYGGAFKDDIDGLLLTHNRTGLLSMANRGPDSNTAQFGILLRPAPHLDGSFVIFGEVVAGIEALYIINGLARGQIDNTVDASAGAIILDSGEVDRSTVNLTRLVRSPLMMKLNPEGV